MTILHIASVDNNPFNGVSVVVPQHVIAQKEYAKVGLLNIKGISITELADNNITQFGFEKPFDNNKLKDSFKSPDFVVFHECYRLEYLTIARKLRKSKIPYIVVPHGELGKEAQKKKHLKKIVANILLFNRFINRAVAIHCLSEREAENTHFGKQKIVIPNGILISTKTKTSFNSSGTRFLYIGRLDSYHKGLDLMIQSFGSIADFLRKNNCSLDIFGPDYNGRFKHVSSLIKNNNVSDIVFLHKAISGLEKEQELMKADIFIQTSRFEGMPMGILEALSCGLPCIVTDGTSLSGQIEKADAGWRASNDTDSIANAIKAAIEQKSLLEHKSKNAINMVETMYSWKIIAKNEIENYMSLLGIKP